MKLNPKNKFMTILIGLATVSLIGISLFGMNKNNESDFLKKLKKLFSDFTKKSETEIVYVQTDKAFYKPSETIWFQAYIRNEHTFLPSTVSDIVRVEIINPKGNVEKEMHLIAKEGTVGGDFSIEENAAGGIYKIKAYTQFQLNFSETLLFEKEFQVQKVILPRVKLKLEFEKEAYGADDEVVAKFNAENLKNEALANTEITFKFALQGKEILAEKIKTDANGKASPSFKLPKNLETADGLLTIILQNNGFTESISRSVPIKMDNLSLEFFPEGGEYLAGFESKMAFWVKDEFGKAADISGEILDNNGKKVANFESFHKGLGSFNFTPEKGKTYSAKINKPSGIKKTYHLPETMTNGYALAVKKQAEKEIEISLFSTVEEELNLIAHVRGNVFFSKTIKAIKGENSMLIPTEIAPIGVAQITLFDSKGIERAERLVFVNAHKQLNVSIKSNKDRYQPREKVSLTIETTDERGIPVPAQLSLSVVDDKLLSFADDKQAHILSKILLESEMKGEIQEPNFYFDKKENKAPQALDLVMLTHGWRKFSWEKIKTSKFDFAHQAEKAVITGIAWSSAKNQAFKGAKVTLLDGSNRQTKTDSAGKFHFENVDLYENVGVKVEDGKFSAQAVFSTYLSNQIINVYDYESSPYYSASRGGGENKKMANNKGRQEMPGNVGAAFPDNAPEMEGKMEMQKNEEGQVQILAAEALPVKEIEDVIEVQNEVVVMDMRKEMAKPNPKLKRDQAGKAKDKIEIDDMAGDEFFGEIADEEPVEIVKNLYYRARLFAAPDYKNDQNPAMRTDFRTTVFWKGDIKTDRKGKTVIEFYNNDDISAFRTTVEGFGLDGSIGRNECVFYTLKPFSMDVKTPISMSMGDEITIPLVLTNNTNELIEGILAIKTPKAWKAKTDLPKNVPIEAGKNKTIFLTYEVMNMAGKDVFEVNFEAKGANDAFQQEIIVNAKGFPSALSISGQEKSKAYSFDINAPVQGTLKAKLTAYPSALSDVLAGIENILREPYGCFEQTSSSTYPNIMVLQYLRDFETSQPEAEKRAKDLIKTGYARLTSFETSEKGYEWFGGAPGHEALTAYGLMEFKDLQSVMPNVIDEKMMQRTAEWLFSKKDGKGGFKRNERALDTYGRADAHITNAYIVYALTEANFFNIEQEADAIFALAESNNDPYFLGLTANIAVNLANANKTQANNKHPKYSKIAEKMIEKLFKLQKESGAFEGLKHSITYSMGEGLHVEATALAIIAGLKMPTIDAKVIGKAINFLISARSPYGGFGNTQSTVLALKALNAYARYAKRTQESGIINVYVNNKKVAAMSYEAGNQNEISLDGLEKYLDGGKNVVKIEYDDKVKSPLPYTLSVTWSTNLPNSSKNCKLSLETKMASKDVKVGENIRLTATLKNTTKDGLPMTMAILGIPGGLSAQAWQLKEMQEKGIFDFYETLGSDVVIYYRQMKPEEIKVINLDLKAEIKGKYEAPASVAYLYYTAEDKFWVKAENVEVK